MQNSDKDDDLMADTDAAYMDDLEPYEETDFIDDEFSGDDWENEASENTTENQKSKKANKKGISFNALVITGAVLLGGVMMFFQLAKPKDPTAVPQEAPFQSALSPTGQINNPVTTKANKPEDKSIGQNAGGEGFLQNPSALEQPVPPAAPSAPNPAQAEESGNGLDDSFSPPMPAPIIEDTAAAQEETPLMPMPGQEQASTQQSESMPQPSPVPNTPEQPNVAPMPVPSDENSTGQMPVPADGMSAEDLLKSKMAEREQAPDSAGSEIVDVPTTPDILDDLPQPAPDSVMAAEEEKEPVVNADVTATAVSPDISAKLDTILTRLDDMDMQITQVRESAQADIEVLKAQMEALQSSSKKSVTSNEAINEAEEPKQEKVSVKPAETEVAKEPVKKTTKKAKSAPVAKKKVWELRAAQPGKAWVSESGNKEMRSVVVGDTLDGIGRVTGITYSSGIWVVEGTNGRITQ